jgi:hypothetical protein
VCALYPLVLVRAYRRDAMLSGIRKNEVTGQLPVWALIQCASLRN